ncbi:MULTISPECIES: ion channel protein [unclassified Streptomyces]|uniref:ion channel protein n=1 Tax=unclassified Streptomyces TaxID=2593676 RepID=UPI001D468FC2|nr:MULTISPECIES: ion channel protein [unclassified Streptomyces]MBD0707648.1 ion channel protein [Streptomyces sp. CBMA291]MBD0713427.1 ion channel protein [Streptomyces sp. CBMA370]
MALDHASPPPDGAPALRVLLPQILPALGVGVGGGLLFLGISYVSERLQHVLWSVLPDALGVDGYSALWIVSLLTATGVAVGLVVWKAPGHAGPDPATTGLGGAPLSPGTTPGLLLASALALAGGVSLGPENPIIATNVALAYWLGRKAAPAVPGAAWVALASAATIGALFGTPVAAALVISEALTGQPGPGSLWDRLFAPLVAAGAGAMTTQLLAEPSFALGLPPLADPGWGDLLAALAIASAAALFGLAACFVFPAVHAGFRRLRHPMLMLPAGGLVLGLLGALGGHLTLFKGLAEVKELTASLGSWSSGELAKLAVVKLVALLVASSCGFRGGRIFPAVFVGAAFGLFVQALVPETHPTVAISAAVLGVLLATTRQGWVSLFTAAVLVASPATLTLLCLASLPAWLLVTGRPQLELDEQGRPLR